MDLDRFFQLVTLLPRETLWRQSAAHCSPYPTSFALDANKLRDTRVLWPSVYQWPHARNYVNDIAVGLKRYIPVAEVEIPQFAGTVMIQFIYREKPFHIAIDYSDYKDRIETESLNRSCVYFKMQYRQEGYSGDPNQSHKIIPGGYINGHSELYHYLPHIRAEAKRNVVSYDVYGRFGLDFAKEVRRKAVDLLRAQSDFRYSGGLKKVRYSLSLLEAAQSRICIDLPSNSDFCFRLIDYFAVGACVIGPRHKTRMHVNLEDRTHIVYARDDLSDLIPLCNYYLASEMERERIGRNAMEYFDRYLEREQLAAYYLYKSLDRIAGNGDIS